LPGSRAAVKIETGRAGLLLFGLLILYLAAVYLGSFFLYIYYVMLFYALFSILQAFVSRVFMRTYQEFSTSHPVKGEELDYSFILSNESRLPSPLLRIRFLKMHPGAPPLLPPAERVLPPGRRLRLKARISCPYRGIYNVGAQYLEVADLLGIIHLRKRLQGRTFYVLPRITELSGLFFSSKRRALSSSSASFGMEDDFSLFEGMKPYREGQSVRHMDWKRFAVAGTPVLKEYGTTAEKGVCIYLDLRPVPPQRGNPHAVEDCVMEVLVSLTDYFLKRGLQLLVRGAGRELIERQITGEAAFGSFHRETASMTFNGTLSPVLLFREDERTSLFITHREDSGVLELAEASAGRGCGTAAILVTLGMDSHVRRGIELYTRELAERGVPVRALRSAEELDDPGPGGGLR
jgi:uncharacterized protein (DUF58 family)